MQEHLSIETDYAVDEDAPLDSAIGRDAYERKINAQERREFEARQFWSQVFASPVGRREMWGILQSANTFTTPFAVGPNGFPQPEASWFKAGAQDQGMRLFLSWQQMNPQGVLLMLQEHDSRFAKPKAPKRKRKLQ